MNRLLRAVKRLLKRLMPIAAFCAIAAVLVGSTVVRVRSNSMASLLCDGDVAIVSGLGVSRPVYWAWPNPPQRGNVVVFKMGGRALVKRIVAIGGDRVQLTGVDVFVNGAKADSPAVMIGTAQTPAARTNALYASGQFMIPSEHVFVLGDNRAESYDSRAFGVVKQSQIVGVVVATLKSPWTRSCVTEGRDRVE